MWVRIQALPGDTHLWTLVRADIEKAEAEEKEARLVAMLDKFRPPKEG